MSTKRSLIFLLLCNVCCGALVYDDFKPAITDTYDLGSISLKWDNVYAVTYNGNGSALTGITGATGGISNTGTTSIIADSDGDSSGVIALQIGNPAVTMLEVTNAGNIAITNAITSGIWNGTAIDISSYTNLVAGTNITLSGDTLNVDDAFLVNNASDTTSGVLTTGGLTITTGNNLTLGIIQWDDGSDKIEGNNLADDSVDDDALDFASITLNDFTVDIASTQLTDTANILYIADLNTFSEFQTLIADKTLLNEEDAATIDSAWTFSSGLTGTLTGDVTGNVDTATILQNTRTFSITGDVATAGGENFNGGANVDMAVSFASGVIVNADVSTIAAISADKLADGSTNAIPTLAQESNWDTHLSSDGSDHAFIDQNVINGSSPVFASATSDNTNMTGNVSVWTNDAGYITSIGGETEAIQDIVGGMVTGNTEVLIDVTYQDADGTLDFVVDEASIDHDALTNFVSGEHFLQSAITEVGTITSGVWNGSQIHINEYTNLVAGTNLTLTNNTLDVDDPVVADLTGDVTGDVTGNADTATSLATGRTIGMTGDVVWTSPSFDGSTNVTAVGAIQPDSVALTTDTTGDYVADITGGTGIDSTGATSGENISHTLSFDSTEIDALAWSGGSNASNIWTFDVSGTDHTMTAGNGLMSFSHALTAAGTITGGTLTDGTTSITGGNYTSVGNITGTDTDISAGTGDFTTTGAGALSYVAINQLNDTAGLKINGFDDVSDESVSVYINAAGYTKIQASSGMLMNSLNDFFINAGNGSVIIQPDLNVQTDEAVDLFTVDGSGNVSIAALTAGRVLFAGTGGVVDDDASLLWNDTDKWMGIGVIPIVPLTVAGHVILQEAGDSRSAPVADTDPHLRIYSSDATQATDYIEMFHNQTFSFISSPSNINLNPQSHTAAATIQYFANSTDYTGIDIGGNFQYRVRTSSEELIWAVSDGVGNQFILTNYDNRSANHDHAPQTNPTLYIHSDTSPNSDNTEWLSFAHNKTNAVFGLGSGVYTFPDSGMTIGSGSTEGETEELRVYGYPTGGALKYGFMKIEGTTNDFRFGTADGTFEFITDEGTNTNTYIRSKGKGTGRGYVEIYDEDDAEYINMRCASGRALFSMAGTSVVAIDLQREANIPVRLFEQATEGLTPEWQLSGFGSGSGGKETLAVSVEKYAANTAEFYGLDNYQFNGAIESIFTAPYLTLHNSTHEDTDGGRESRLNFKGEQSGGEETTLVRQEVGHDGAADDQKGYWDLYTNDGSDGDSPTRIIRVDSDSIQIRNNKEWRLYDNGNYVGFEAPALSADQIWVLPTADGSDGDVLTTNGSGTLSWLSGASEKSWSFRSRSGASGTTYAGGFYKHSGTANDFSGGPTFGTANSSYAAHFFVVTGADTVDELTLTVSGTSITDAGVRDATPDTENIVIPDSTSAGAYYETSKKWLGQVTITVAGGTAKTCDFGLAKYWDNNNTDFAVTGLEVTWLGGATDTAPNLILRHHKGAAGNTDWTYTGSGATPPMAVAAMATDHSTAEDNVINGENGAWKRTNLSESIIGSGSEGVIWEIITTANKTFELGTILMRITPQ